MNKTICVLTYMAEKGFYFDELHPSMFYLENNLLRFVHFTTLRKKEQPWTINLYSRLLKFCAPEVKKSFMR